MEDVLVGRWPKAIERNLLAFRSGLAAANGNVQERELQPGGDLGVVG
jgi:hypothetical protein